MKDFEKDLDRSIDQIIEAEVAQQTHSGKILNNSVALIGGFVIIIVGILLLKKLNKTNKYIQVAGWTLIGIGVSGALLNGIQLILSIILY